MGKESQWELGNHRDQAKKAESPWWGSSFLSVDLLQGASPQIRHGGAVVRKEAFHMILVLYLPPTISYARINKYKCLGLERMKDLCHF